MPQTVLGFLGLLLVSFLTLTQLRSDRDTDWRLNEADIHALASEVAMGYFEQFDAVAYDEAVAAAYVTAPEELSLFSNDQFFAPGGSDPSGNDLDDFHNTSSSSSHVVREGKAALAIQTQFKVAYVEEADGVTPSAVRTRFKRVTATVQPTDGSAKPVRISQLYSCGSYCSW